MGNENSILEVASWPEYDPEALIQEEIELPVQINGKLRARVKVPYDADEETVKSIVLEDIKVREKIGDHKLKKFIVVRNKIVNIVI